MTNNSDSNSSSAVSSTPTPSASGEQLPKVAQSVHINCKKCGVDRYHRVLFHVNATSAKVECEVCKSRKTYSIAVKKAGAKKASGKGKTTTAASSGRSQKTKWLEWSVSNQGLSPQSYSIKGKFIVEQALSHPKFGLGLVLSSQAGSIDVLFEEGVKKLMHQR